MVYSGMGPDYRLLIRRARKMAQDYYLMYHEPIPTAQLVYRVALVMQEYTQSGGVRPFGVSLLICGWDEPGKPLLFQVRFVLTLEFTYNYLRSVIPVGHTLPGRQLPWARTMLMGKLS